MNKYIFMRTYVYMFIYLFLIGLSYENSAFSVSDPSKGIGEVDGFGAVFLFMVSNFSLKR
jgi:hypothetical protein